MVSIIKHSNKVRFYHFASLLMKQLLDYQLIQKAKQPDHTVHKFSLNQAIEAVGDSDSRNYVIAV